MGADAPSGPPPVGAASGCSPRASARWWAARDDTSGDAAPTTVPPTTVPFDPDTPWWLQGGFAPVADEVEAVGPRGRRRPAARARRASTCATDRTRGPAVRPTGSSATAWCTASGSTGGGRRCVPQPLRPHAALRGVGRLRRGRARAARPRRATCRPSGTAAGCSPRGEVGYPYELSPADLSTVGVHDFDGRLTTVDDRAPEDRSGHRRDALLRLRLRGALPHLPRGRRRRARSCTAPSCRWPGRR